MEVMYKLKNGKIVSERDIRTAFNILVCEECNDNSHNINSKYVHFLDGLFKNGNIVWYGTPTLDELISSGSKVCATMKYREEHGCGLREAKDAVDKLIAERFG